MVSKSIRVLVSVDLPSGTIRMWDGSGGPFMDADGEIWRSCTLTDDAIDQIEMAINAQAFTLSLAISGIDTDTSNKIWADYESGQIIGSRVRVMLQELDDFEQPVGAADVKFTGSIDNLVFGDDVSGGQIKSVIAVEITNRFTLRKLTNGSVLSDVDQRARSKILNPTGNPDRFCERIPLLVDKTIAWPNFG
ncbi:hypothetical protein [Rhizobium grahamii]|uniref:Uncharacterized protein n=1 Tax=Rhizobium grahamii CCGE 502 TaxID=990285 RepID=S3HA49_9HYPH|nr:hypothetical protein [Rhizobium grahamii]EPE95707.1 hypothetical protein RGCCGE502_22695 [Rhizobium grahamii CCGE 502]